MPMIAEATYKNGALILEQGLGAEIEGKIFTIVIIDKEKDQDSLQKILVQLNQEAQAKGLTAENLQRILTEDQSKANDSFKAAVNFLAFDFLKDIIEDAYASEDEKKSARI